MNILIVTDCNWNNFGIVHKRLKSLQSDCNINFCYGPNMQAISNLCAQLMLHLFRRSLIEDKLTKSMNEIVKFMDVCIIFHNFLEYNTMSSYVMEVCLHNNIPFYVFSEHNQDYFFNLELNKMKFKSSIKTINVSGIPRKLHEIKEIDTTFEICKPIVVPSSITDIVKKLRRSYSKIEDDKKEKSTVILSKQEMRSAKELSYLEYIKNKKKWMKNVMPKS
jgi:hypothetical protein